MLADSIFYNKYFFGWKKCGGKPFYNEYDILNQDLIKAYDLTYVPEGTEQFFEREMTGETVEYHYEKVVQFIEEVSNYDLYEVAEKIKNCNDFKFIWK